MLCLSVYLRVLLVGELFITTKDMKVHKGRVLDVVLCPLFALAAKQRIGGY